jgi:UDP-N-acetyl-L-fucosamine synthase
MHMNNHNWKIMTILGTRPEIIRLSRVIAQLDKYSKHVLVYTNQSYDYELSTIFFNELRIRKPDYVLSVKSETLSGQIGNILTQTEQVMSKEKPDAILVLGDTNSALSGIIAKRKKIPLFHMEAGNRCFDWDVPEEINRRIVDHISDYNLAYTEHGRRYLLQEGIPANNIIVTGSPLTEVYQYYKKYLQKGLIFKELKLVDRQYIVVSCHREENIENATRMRELFDTLKFLKAKYHKRVLVSLHPRTRARIPDKEWEKEGIEVHKPFGFFPFIQLEKHAFCVLSDSGTIQEESSILGFPAVQIRYSTERPEAFDAGSIVVCGLGKRAVENAIELVTAKDCINSIPQDYRDAYVSQKVVRFIVGSLGVRKG